MCQALTNEQRLNAICYVVITPCLGIAYGWDTGLFHSPPIANRRLAEGNMLKHVGPGRTNHEVGFSPLYGGQAAV